MWYKSPQDYRRFKKKNYAVDNIKKCMKQDTAKKKLWNGFKYIK